VPRDRIERTEQGRRIEIRLAGEPVDKVRAAAALSEAVGMPVCACEIGEDGSTGLDVDVFARHRAFGGTCGPEVNWSATGSVSATVARRFAEMFSLGAELADLADTVAVARPPDGDGR